MRTSNRIVLDLSKVQHGTFYYMNQYGQVVEREPFHDTIRKTPVVPDELAYPHPDFVGELALDRAKRLGLLDVWTPVVTFQLTANHNIQYTGKKARSMWAAWNERIFNQKKKK